MSSSVPTRYECGVCWLVYDAAEGDPAWQVPPGTSFEDLPETWCCPNCDASRARFIRVSEDR